MQQNPMHLGRKKLHQNVTRNQQATAFTFTCAKLRNKSLKTNKVLVRPKLTCLFTFMCTCMMDVSKTSNNSVDHFLKAFVALWEFISGHMWMVSGHLVFLKWIDTLTCCTGFYEHLSSRLMIHLSNHRIVFLGLARIHYTVCGVTSGSWMS